MNILKDFLFVGTGGFIGAILRYFICFVFANHITNSFPFATLMVNTLGSLIIGFLGVFLQNSNDYLKLFFLVGILGGFTTFSSFSHETMVLLNNNQLFHALANITLNVFLCLLCVFIGFQAGKAVIL
jgi:CrcB protein